MKIKLFNVGIIDTNCYLVTDEISGESVVVDPGAMSPELESALKESKVKYILLTHGHFDHITGVSELKENTAEKLLFIRTTKRPSGIKQFLFPLSSVQRRIILKGLILP